MSWCSLQPSQDAAASGRGHGHRPGRDGTSQVKQQAELEQSLEVLIAPLAARLRPELDQRLPGLKADQSLDRPGIGVQQGEHAVVGRAEGPAR